MSKSENWLKKYAYNFLALSNLLSLSFSLKQETNKAQKSLSGILTILYLLKYSCFHGLSASLKNNQNSVALCLLPGDQDVSSQLQACLSVCMLPAMMEMD